MKDGIRKFSDRSGHAESGLIAEGDRRRRPDRHLNLVNTADFRWILCSIDAVITECPVQLYRFRLACRAGYLGPDTGLVSQFVVVVKDMACNGDRFMFGIRLFIQCYGHLAR